MVGLACALAVRDGGASTGGGNAWLHAVGRRWMEALSWFSRERSGHTEARGSIDMRMDEFKGMVSYCLYGIEKGKGGTAALLCPRRDVEETREVWDFLCATARLFDDPPQFAVGGGCSGRR